MDRSDLIFFLDQLREDAQLRTQQGRLPIEKTNDILAAIEVIRDALLPYVIWLTYISLMDGVVRDG